LRKLLEANALQPHAWLLLAHLLARQNRPLEAETAFKWAASFNPRHSSTWDALGNLYCDHLGRFAEAESAFSKSLETDPERESALHNLVFLKRDFMGEIRVARSLFEDIPKLGAPVLLDTLALQEALFSAYAGNWGVASSALDNALQSGEVSDPKTTDDWMRASAVLLHLDYGDELLKFLEERGDGARLRPWYEAIRALHLGDRGYLLNIAPEVRTLAEKFYDQIEMRLSKLPESTRRRPLPKKKAKKGAKKNPPRL